MNHSGAKRLCPLVHRSLLREDAIKSPTNLYSLRMRMLEHAHEPILHRAAVEIFNDVEDSQNDLGMPPREGCTDRVQSHRRMKYQGFVALTT